MNDLVTVSKTNANIIFDALNGNRGDSAKAALVIVAALADRINDAEGLVASTDFLFEIQERINSLVDVAETKVIAEFKGRGEDLLAQIVNLGTN